MADESSQVSSSKPKQKLNLSLDLRLVCALLVIVIVAMLAIWKPWQSQPNTSARTISVTGSATIKSAPDVFVFSPTYEAQNTDKSAASQEVIAKQESVVAGLKKLGVAGNKIKTDTGGYNNSYIDSTDVYHYSTTVQVTVDASNKALIQKIQDYLVSTEPTGQLSPYGSFSDELRHKLEAQARDKATKDARSKADQSAKNLGFSVGKVKSVDDGSGASGHCLDMCTAELSKGSNLAVGTDSAPSLSVQPGEDELSYSVTVVYYVK